MKSSFAIGRFAARSAAMAACVLSASSGFAADAKLSPKVTVAGRPVGFEANRGQTESQVRFIGRSDGCLTFFKDTEAVIELRDHSAFRGRQKKDTPLSAPKQAVVRMRFLDANATPRIAGEEAEAGRRHYVTGNDPDEWQSDVPMYRRLRYKQVWPGIDVAFYHHQGRLEQDFIVAPGVDAGAIRLMIDGAKSLRIDETGDLRADTAIGALRWQKLQIYQSGPAGQRTMVGGRWVLGEDQELGFAITEAYDRERPLIIDPVLAYATYLGGSGGSDEAASIALDGDGNMYVTGLTDSVDFPGAGTPPAALDAFISKLAPDGTSIIYTTIFGGEFVDVGFGVAVGADNLPIVTGITTSLDFPTTTGAFDRTHVVEDDIDGFVTKFNSAGTLTPMGTEAPYSSYFGGQNEDQCFDIDVGADGSAYITGKTFKLDGAQLPTTARVFQPAYRGGPYDAFVAKFNPAGSALIYCTYFGSAGEDVGFGIAVDGEGNAYVTGYTTGRTTFPTTPGAFQRRYGGGLDDAFAAKLNPFGVRLVYSTFLGGELRDVGDDIAVDPEGRAYITGDTYSAGFPRRRAYRERLRGTSDVFVTALNRTGDATYSTYLGCSASDGATGVAADAFGHAHVTGTTTAGDFPLVRPFQSAFRGDSDAFVVKLNAFSAAPLYSSLLGGSQGDLALGIAVGTGGAYLAGDTSSAAEFPVTAAAVQPVYGGGSHDGFVARVADLPSFELFTEPRRVDPASDGLFTVRFFGFDPDPRLININTMRFGANGVEAAPVRVRVHQAPNKKGASFMAQFRINETGLAKLDANDNPQQQQPPPPQGGADEPIKRVLILTGKFEQGDEFVGTALVELKAPRKQKAK